MLFTDVIDHGKAYALVDTVSTMEGWNSSTSVSCALGGRWKKTSLAEISKPT